ncbi:substrate-binding periplasmic protein [Rugamonas sp. CCM 8940]|uniref:substrate-binding periplasmic protein n=1 Tax=Rugamonas sp. CCM 8940 TaxID=2765359 RepID=UPI0018F2E529|nr:transporter substrate-binding domain-containing protein [Rugamonas sp. CCM 8940]MBJ7314263.1 transporter substrate-binding domain-containing protein [Rugamonas sp. CCM 8940]
MSKRLAALLACSLLSLAARGAPAELVMLASTDQLMPLADIKHGELGGGIVRDLGEAIAKRLGRKVRFVVVAGDQTGRALVKGKADGMCYVLPYWIDGDFDWSQPFLPDAEMVASVPGAPAIPSLTALRGKSIGTVSAYRYPRVEQVLGAQFVRVDSETMETNLRRVVNGELQYALVSQMVLDYQLRMDKQLKLRPGLVFASFKAQCAFSRRSGVPFAEVDRVIKGLVKDGTVERILASYR